MTDIQRFPHSTLSVSGSARSRSWVSSDACQYWLLYIVAFPLCLIAAAALRLQWKRRAFVAATSILREAREMAGSAISMAF